MGRPQLHLVTDSRLPLPRLLAIVDGAVDGGVDIVQVRDKAAPLAALVSLVRAVRDAVAGRAPVIVNGGVEMACASDADGIHLPEGRPDLGYARQVLGSTAYIGASVHGVLAARMADQAGVSSVTFGHIFATASHPGEPARGLAALREVAAAVDIPVMAIGGITVQCVPEVLAAGASGIAVIAAIFAAEDPRAAAAGLRAALDAGGKSLSSHSLYSR